MLCPETSAARAKKSSARDLCILREELARGDALADTMFALQALGSYPITLAGSAAQKQNYLARVAGGAAIAAFAITEPEAGSDVASLQTKATAPRPIFRFERHQAIYFQRRYCRFLCCLRIDRSGA